MAQLLMSEWRSSWGALLLAAGGHAIVWAVLVALLLAAIVGGAFYLPRPSRPYAGLIAALTFAVLLLILLV